jgi:hypothetical protein
MRTKKRKAVRRKPKKVAKVLRKHITGRTSIRTVIQRQPKTEELFVHFGLICPACGPELGSIDEAAEREGIDVEMFLKKLKASAKA